MIWLIENPMFRIGAWGFLKKAQWPLCAGNKGDCMPEYL